MFLSIITGMTCSYNPLCPPPPHTRCLFLTSVVHPDPAETGIICKIGSGSVINSGSGSKLSFVSNQQIQSCKNVQIKKKFSFFAMFR